MVSKAPIYRASASRALRQGEIITGLEQTVINLNTLQRKQGKIDYEVYDIPHPYAIVVSQDCDLEQDFNLRAKLRVKSDATLKLRLLESILFCVVEAADKTASEHPLDEVRSSRGFERIVKNKDERFHYFEAILSQNDSVREGLPELVVEFKRFFTIPTAEVYKKLRLGLAKRRCQLCSPYLEHFSVRFHYYHSRVALPHDHTSE